MLRHTAESGALSVTLCFLLPFLLHPSLWASRSLVWLDRNISKHSVFLLHFLQHWKWAVVYLLYIFWICFMTNPLLYFEQWSHTVPELSSWGITEPTTLYPVLPDRLRKGEYCICDSLLHYLNIKSFFYYVKPNGVSVSKYFTITFINFTE